MKASIEYLKEAKEKLGCETDYQLAKALKTSTTNISRYMSGETLMDDFHCLVVAKSLGIDPMKIIAAAQEEREKNEEKRGVWRDFREAREREKGRAIVPVMAALTGLMMMAMVTIPHLSEATGFYKTSHYAN
ncbi:helix-turn-helix domain-containing protein [Aquitalea aquatilis]|uniref:helix-turn-helix domain-containing protein n=1 Tax=Aquitalea aquatilis TaxID=1537400 RepID=UPI0010BDF77A|nr:helix-turn-helix transcriptional regulator [Aquitalea aquatilis]